METFEIHFPIYNFWVVCMRVHLIFNDFDCEWVYRMGTSHPKYIVVNSISCNSIPKSASVSSIRFSIKSNWNGSLQKPVNLKMVQVTFRYTSQTDTRYSTFMRRKLRIFENNKNGNENSICSIVEKEIQVNQPQIEQVMRYHANNIGNEKNERKNVQTRTISYSLNAQGIEIRKSAFIIEIFPSALSC